MDGTSIDVEALWDRYAPMVLRRCRALLRNEDEAMDVSQDVFVKVLGRQSVSGVRKRLPSLKSDAGIDE